MPVDFQNSSYWVLLVSGWLAVSQTIIPEAQEHFLTPSARRDTHIFGGLGLNKDRVTGWKTVGMVYPQTGRPPTVEDFQALWMQQGEACGMCEKSFIVRHRRREPMLDHDHTTGLVRGIICQSCNVTLGRPPDYLGKGDRADKYLGNPPAMAGLAGGLMPLLPYTSAVSARSTGGYATRKNSPAMYAVAPLGPEHGGLSHSEAARRRQAHLRRASSG